MSEVFEKKFTVDCEKGIHGAVSDAIASRINVIRQGPSFPYPGENGAYESTFFATLVYASESRDITRKSLLVTLGVPKGSEITVRVADIHIRNGERSPSDIAEDIFNVVGNILGSSNKK